MTTANTTNTNTLEILADRERFLFPCAPPYYDEPIVIADGKGLNVIDSEGREYLDFFSGILTTGIGHCHPEVVARVREQVGRIGHTSTLYVTEPHVAYARRLAELTPGDLNLSFLTNSGTEAVETAIMLAHMYTGRSEIIALRYGYSGRSMLATNMTGHASWRPLPSTIPVKHVLAPYPYRCPFKSPCDETCVDAFGRDLEEAIVTTTNGQPAAFMAETILGVGGYIVPPPGYFQRAAEIIRHYGGLFICDEVQAGFGRTGGKWFGIEHWDVVPDIMVLAKTIANGFPMGATVTRDEIAAAWSGKTISTFGGNPIATTAALATSDIMMREDVPKRSAERGAQLRTGLETLQKQHSWIGNVSGMGLMQALELVDDPVRKTASPRKAKALMEATKQQGLLLGIGGLHGQTIRCGPSMLVTEAQIDDALNRLNAACEAVSQSS